MWVCRGCKMLVTLQVAEPAIDDDGVYFTCPVCRRRNPLVALPRANPDDPLELEQVILPCRPLRALYELNNDHNPR
jgi:hypothetical protein